MDQKQIMNCQKCGIPKVNGEVFLNHKGICNFCRLYEEKIKPKLASNKEFGIERLAEDTKEKYGTDEVNVPISGGVDSCFTAHLAKQYFKKVNLIHVDTGWNTSQAIRNINSIASAEGFTFHSAVLPWRDQQKMYHGAIKHGIHNLDIIQDNAIFAALDDYSKSNQMPFWFGQNLKTEFVHFQNWHESYRDVLLLWFLKLQTKSTAYKILPLKSRLLQNKIRPLDYIDYDKKDAMKILNSTYGYEVYSEKHSESLMTKFFQNVYAPQKGMIKRLQHEANLAIVGERAKLPDNYEITLSQLSKAETYFVFQKLKIEDSLLDNWPNKSLSSKLFSLNTLFKIYRTLKL